MNKEKKEPKTVVDVDLLKGIITAKKLKQRDVYKSMNLTKRQWETRLKIRQFSSDEIAELIFILNINSLEDVASIFFAPKDTQEVSNND